MKRFSGIVPVLVTPLNRDGSLDNEGLINLTNYYIDKNVSGLWVLGTGGEDMGLTFKQRIQVAQTVSDTAAGKLKLTVGASFYSVLESVEFLKETKQLDFDSYHAMPYHPKVSSKQIINWYQNLADNAEKPFWAYTSGNWAQHITPNMIKELKNHGNFEGVKYSTSNIVELQEVSYLNCNDFQVISAVIKSYFYSLCLGLESATSVEATAFLDEIRNVEKAYVQDGVVRAYEAQKKLNEILKYPSPSSKDNFLRVAELKLLISKRVDMKPFMSHYYRNLTSCEIENLENYCI